MTFAGRWRGCSVAILALACAASGRAQPTPPQARIAGHVLNQAGEPLRNATVALVGNNPTPAAPFPPSYTATSSAAGEFAFEKVEPNSYRLFVQRAGYLEFLYSEPDGSVSMPIAEGQQKTVEIRMTGPSFLSGRITDENGEAFPDARVTVLRASRSRGKKQLARVSQIVAGRDGLFSTGSLTAGRYYLAASAPPSPTQTNQREVREGKAGAESYVGTYFPSALDATTATLIELPADTEVRNLDIRLRKARIFHIYGKTVNASGAAVSNITINLRDPAVNDPLNSANRVVSIGGTFSVNGLLPGTYALQAWSQNRSLQAHQTLTLADRDLEDVVLTLAPALEIPLSVRLEEADPQRAQAMRKSLGRFTLTASDGLNENAMAQSKDDGWIFRNLGAGTYRMGIGGPDGTYVKSIPLANKILPCGSSTLPWVAAPWKRCFPRMRPKSGEGFWMTAAKDWRGSW